MIFEIEKPLFGTMIIEQGLFLVQLKQKKEECKHGTENRAFKQAVQRQNSSK